jgi:hypothetical protein
MIGFIKGHGNDDDDEDLENNESISCGICLENYTNEKIPMILKCSHTLCKNCLSGILKKEHPKCPNCNMEIKKNLNENDINGILWENKIILNLVDLCNFLNIDANIFLSFPLNFKYCKDCQIFITNYSFISHKSLKHKLLSFNNILKLFFEKHISLDNNLYMMILLYYYKSAFLPKYKYFEVKKSFSIGNSQFKFYGQIADDNILYSNLIKNSKNNLGEKLHKGVLINKEKGLLIHGYFFIKIQNKILLISKILGLLSYKETKFYGFIKINKNNNEKLNIEDFILEYGLLYDKNYYFGAFNEEYMKTYFLNRDENNNSNKKILKKGEIISLRDDVVEVEEIKENSSPIIPVPVSVPVPVTKPVKKPKNKIQIKNSIIEINNKKECISIEPLNKGVDINTFNNFHLNECNIYLSKYNDIQFKFLIKIKNKNSIIIINNFKSTLKNNINYQEGYLIDFIQNQSESLNSLNYLSLKDIIDNVDYFVENLHKLLKTEIKYCKMECCYFKNINNSLDKIDKKYYEINPYFIKEIKKNKSSISEKIYRENDVLNTAKIEDILNGLLKDIVKFNEEDFYDDKSKNEGCLTI